MNDNNKPSGLIRSFNKIAPNYDRYFSWFLRKLWNAVGELAQVQAGSRVLDVCCGTGGVSLELARRGASVVGVDLSEGMLAQAKIKAQALTDNGHKVQPPTFDLMNVCELKFDDNSFDLATVSMAIHELPADKRRQALKEMARVAKKGIIVADYNIPKSGITRYLRLALLVFELYETPNFKEFTRFDFPSAFDDLGLKEESIKDVTVFRVHRAIPV